jgi:glycosyltransferase involved in cell wall biosynthesis
MNEESQKKIVLVTTIYNRVRYLPECLDSALNSTLDKEYWIHLLIDNASSDGAQEIAREYCDEHEHMYLIENEDNIGQMPAYNYALDWVQEKFSEITYLSMLDSDDRIARRGLEVCLDLFENEPLIDISYSGFHMMGKDGEILLKNHPKSKRIMPKEIELTEEGQRRYRVAQINKKSGNLMTHLRFLRLSSFFEKMGRFKEDKEFSTDFNIYTSALDCEMMLGRADVGDDDTGVLYLWRSHGKRKNWEVNQVERDHGEIQHAQWQELREFYEEKWKEEGRI